MGLSDLLIYDGTTPIPLIIWAIYIGLAFAVIVSYIIRDKYGKFVNKMIEIEANSPEKAVTLDEVDIGGKWFIKLALKNNLNYKDALVAITPDGKYYANYRYTDKPPAFKTFKAISRSKKSRLGSKIKESVTEDDATTIEQTADTQETTTVTNTKADTETADAEATTPDYEYKRERVRFSPTDARFYIPTEVNDKVKGIYNTEKSKLWMIALALIAGAIITYFATPVIEQMLRMWSEI